MPGVDKECQTHHYCQCFLERLERAEEVCRAYEIIFNDAGSSEKEGVEALYALNRAYRAWAKGMK
jgi:hypothetical protein